MILLKKHEEITFLIGFILKILLNSSKSSALLWTFTNYQRFRNKSAERKKEKWKKTLAFCKKVWYYNLRKMAGCGAVGSALPWGGRGRGFKSRHSDHKSTAILIELRWIFYCPKTAWNKAFRLFQHISESRCRAILRRGFALYMGFVAFLSL